MKTILYHFFLLAYFSFVAGNVSGQMATNPIIFADVPDPDFVRVGDTYYMSSTTMHFNPGVPIMKSKDLVNWEVVSYCYPIMANTDALNLNGGMEAYSGGTWASSINYYKGTFYVSSFSYSTGKTYIYKTTNIETGPWTTITLNKVYHDHSLFFDDDGKVYFAYGHDNIQLTEMKPDLTGEQPGGVNKVIIPKASSVAGSSMILTAEGTRMQKINGQYYVSNICWPSGKGRTQIIHRSGSVAGTYTGRIAFQSSNGSAQGEYIDTPDGKWYAMFFHDHGAVGRIPDLMPVTWSNGWPTVGVNGQVPATLDIPKGAGSLKGIITSDEFSAAPPLKLQWQWNHNPQNNYWSLTQRSGYMRLTNERTDANVLRTTNTLTQRTFGPKCSGYVSIDVSGLKDGDYAGLVALQNKYGLVGVKMTGTSKSIVMVNGTGFSGTPVEVASVPLNQNTVYLRIDFDFTNRTDKAYFYFSLNGSTWNAIGSTLQMNYDLEHFVGYRFGLFSYATKSSGGYADFDFFRVGANITEAQNVGPVVSITSPANGTRFTAGSDINIAATASTTAGTIANVQFYNGNTLLGSDNSSPYSYNWMNVPAGGYLLRVVATDNAGRTSESQVSVTVNVPKGPFNGTLHSIPGMIEAEEYDEGGEGVSFHEVNTNGNEGGAAFRNDEVDIETTGDASGSFNIGYILKGEWLEYSVNVTETGIYDLNFRVAADGTGKTFHVEMDGVDITGVVSVPNTGGWQIWETVAVPGIQLTNGQHVMRIVFDSDYMNLNWVEFKNEIITDLEQEYNSPALLFPNPFQEVLQITCDEKTEYQILDLTGRELESGTLYSNAIVGKSLPKGQYLLKLTSEKGMKAAKILKQ
ncbi:MAG: family 43 glycosylhydrolase [Sporocytophaga sp.]|nr:family 43 glycosylhydrolase [Sporocytophaga sp.]